MRKAKQESVVIAKHINKFLNEYLPTKSQSDNTAKSHAYAVSLYLEFLEKEKGIAPERLDSNCFSREMIEDWIQWLLTSRGCSAQTCNVRLASMRKFLKYLADEDVSLLHISQSASHIQRQKHIQQKVIGMSKAAVQALMSAPDTSTAAGRRDLALIVTIYSTAARIDEILSMKVKQLHLDKKRPHVTVIGKGKKIRTLYLLPKAVAHLKQHIKEYHGACPNPESYVFYSRNAGPLGMMSQMSVNKRLKLHAAEAHKSCFEVPLDLHAHQLRHAKASHWLEDGINIVQISLLLGHEQLTTTMAYIDVGIEQKMDALATLADEKNSNVSKMWKFDKSSLASFCGAKPIK